MTLKTKKSFTFYLTLVLITSVFCISAIGQTDLNKQNWIHGSEDCEKNTDEPIQVVQYDESTWILRQNMCTNYEAPFMFLFLGQKKALLMDTGATREEEYFPLYKTVNIIVDTWQKQQNKKIELIVAHTHKHGDHFSADTQFKEKANTTIVGLEKTDVIDFFKLTSWPTDIVDFELGNRILKIVPIPGHQEASIAIYDTSSKLLLTGDTFYPGRLYVEDWSSFKTSVNRLVEFSKKHEIKYILGNHIEMTSTDGVDFPMGSTNHPEEHKLPLNVEDLESLQSSLNNLGDKPTKKAHKNFIIYPIN
ncbi:MBL fold metallo-hydrolase [Lutimonas sp.]|uniref:MBL fold metallo-hydrolase n=1 Tax=Lutimonas sp. TaxID=1872403 RepID=UPI003D9AB718